MEKYIKDEKCLSNYTEILPLPFFVNFHNTALPFTSVLDKKKNFIYKTIKYFGILLYKQTYLNKYILSFVFLIKLYQLKKVLTAVQSHVQGRGSGIMVAIFRFFQGFKVLINIKCGCVLVDQV